MIDWSGWKQGAGSEVPARDPRRPGGSAAGGVGLLLVVAALLMIASGVILSFLHDPGGGLGFQGRLTLASTGANALTALILIAAMVVVRPSVIGSARPGAVSGGGTAAAGLLASVLVLLAGGFDTIAAFTERPVLPGVLGGISLSFGTTSSTLPANYHLSALADGLAVLALGAAAVWLSRRALSER